MTPTSAEIGETSRIHIFVTGKVQGVGFRAFVERSASQLGLTGWVRNVGYDQVETVAEGDSTVLKAFLETVRAGPRSSRVDQLSLTWEPPLAETTRFEIRYR
jgi:acylphosphatase